MTEFPPTLISWVIRGGKTFWGQTRLVPCCQQKVTTYRGGNEEPIDDDRSDTKTEIEMGRRTEPRGSGTLWLGRRIRRRKRGDSRGVRKVTRGLSEKKNLRSTTGCNKTLGDH